MSLQERLLEDLRDAMRQKDELRRTTLRMIRAAVQNEEIALQKPLDDAGILKILATQVRQHQESITEFHRGKRLDLVEKEEAELAIIRQYMPQQVSQEEITQMARDAIAKVGARGPSDMGKVMGQLMPQLRGKADGSQVSQVVAQLLAG
ncbi:MAG: GatB/YqeY domain-containing protein [Dehalococcoidia bacterium]|nr:GatB/YqeY domain-containing protein [Dehalococcoidia bacterium]